MYRFTGLILASCHYCLILHPTYRFMSGFFDHPLFLSLFSTLPFCPYSEQTGDAYTSLSRAKDTFSSSSCINNTYRQLVFWGFFTEFCCLLFYKRYTVMKRLIAFSYPYPQGTVIVIFQLQNSLSFSFFSIVLFIIYCSFHQTISSFLLPAMYRTLIIMILHHCFTMSYKSTQRGEPFCLCGYEKCNCGLYQEGLLSIRWSTFIRIFHKHSGSQGFAFLSLLLCLTLPSFDNVVKVFDDVLKEKT